MTTMFFYTNCMDIGKPRNINEYREHVKMVSDMMKQKRELTKRFIEVLYEGLTLRGL